MRRATQADGTRKQIAYDPHGNVVLEVNELGTYTLHAYDALNRRIRTTVSLDGDPAADPRESGEDLVVDVTYNGMNLPVTETGPTGLVTEHAYDHLGRRTSTTVNPGGGVLELETTFVYGANSGGSVFDTSGFKPTESEGPRGEVTTVVYDDLYRPTSTTVSLGGTMTTVYDAVSRPIEVTDALNRTTTTTYDHLGQVTKVEYEDGTEVHSEYTHHGQPWRVEDALGRVTTKRFDAAGRALSVTDALGNKVSTTYDAAGNAISVTDARLKTTETTYDALNRPIEVKAPEVTDGETGLPARPVSTTTYDAAGKPLTVTDPLGHVTTTTYDRVGRVVKVKNALNQETLSTYNAAGQVLTVTDANGKVTTNAYDVLGRLTQTTDAENVVTQFEYDKAGNRTLVRDGKGNETTFAYDVRNRVTSETYANGDQTSYTYNALQKLTRTDAAGTTSYSYDDLDRLVTVDFVTGPDRTYAYDDAGQLLSVTESGHAAANVSYTYDLAGRVLSETSRGKTHTYTYDAQGNRTSTTYGTGTSRSETRTYDALNRITELEEGGRTTGWHYDLAGRAIALSLGNGQQQDNHYDAVGKLTARHLFNPNQTLIATFTWQHDAVGNVTQQTERWLGDASRNNALRTATMVYDDVYRLLGETVTQSGEVTKDTLYTYDDASNRATKVEKDNGTVVKDTTYTYNTANQLTAWSEENGAEVVQRSAVMTYDTRGNRASTAVTTNGETPTMATTTYTWTPQNMLSSVTLPDNGVHSYAYDYRVRRITRTEGSANPVAMTFSGGLSVAEYEVTNPGAGTLNVSPDVEYQRGPDMGGGVGGLLYSLRSGTAKFNLSNGRGDVVAQSDASGDLTWTASYEAYGKRPVETGSNLDRQRANTKEEDPTGLLNEGFRYRDLETGTWLSRDPAGFVDGPNLYAYVRQNPWSKFDPDGLAWKGLAFGYELRIGLDQRYLIDIVEANAYSEESCDVNFFDFKEGGKRLDALKRSPWEFFKGTAGGLLGTDWGSGTEEGRKGQAFGGNVAVLDAIATRGRTGKYGRPREPGPPAVPVPAGGGAVPAAGVPAVAPTAPPIPANVLFQTGNTQPQAASPPTATAQRTQRPKDGSSMTTERALAEARSYLGSGYRELDKGVYVSQDGTRLVRMTDSDLAKVNNHAGAPHMNFEEGQLIKTPNLMKPGGVKETFKTAKDGNSHVYLPEEL